MRVLVVNADDFGLSAGVNAGIVHAHENGIVTSASLMVRQPAAAAAADYARGNARLGVGLHVDLGEWIFRGGEWHAVYERVLQDDAEAVLAEVERQLERFRALVGRDPDHLDSHQHVHRREPARAVIEKLARDLDLPLRDAGPIRFCGDFYGQTESGQPLGGRVGVDALLAIFDRLPEGATELACHPGFVEVDDPLGGTMYRDARNAEVAALCDPRVRAGAAARGIEFVDFARATQFAGGRR